MSYFIKEEEEILKKIRTLRKREIDAFNEFDKRFRTIYDHKLLVKKIIENTTIIIKQYNKLQRTKDTKEAVSIIKDIDNKKKEINNWIFNIKHTILGQFGKLSPLFKEEKSAKDEKQKEVENYYLDLQTEYLSLNVDLREKAIQLKKTNVAKKLKEINAQLEKRIIGKKEENNILDKISALIKRFRSFLDQIQETIEMELRTLNNRFLFNDNEIKNKNISEEKIEILKAGIPELRNEYKILEDILRAEDTIFRKPFIELLTKENSWITRQRKYLDEKFEKLTPGTIWKKITNTLLLRKITEDDIRDDIRHMTESKEALEYIKILIGRFDYYLTKKAKEYIIKIMGKSIIVGDKKKKELEMTLFASEFDALTKLPDNRKYKKDIKKIISEFKRYEKTFSLAIFDIDKFKTFNDDYGHATGDVVLATVAKIASEHTRESDTLYRYGGEEFTAIFPNTDKKGAMKACEAIRKAIEKKSTPVMDIINETQEKSKKKRDEITVSIGVSDTEDLSLQSIDNNDEAGIAMFELADKALYRAKETGRNKVIGYRKAS